jgi:hypothetical protein
VVVGENRTDRLLAAAGFGGIGFALGLVLTEWLIYRAGKEAPTAFAAFPLLVVACCTVSGVLAGILSTSKKKSN